MIRRCTSSKHTDYKNYGGRGIRVCERWLNSFENFLADVGERPMGKTLDRRENEGNYEPGNCRWATATEQNRNSRHTKLNVDLVQEILGRLEHGEGSLSIARRMGVTPQMICAIRDGKTWREMPRAQVPQMA